MNCKICGTFNQVCFGGKILGKYDIKYYHCSNCGFVQTEEPYWLDEAYSRSINVSDVGYMMRNILYAKRMSILLYLLFGKNGKYVDYAAGYGVFVRLMRDIGFDFYWNDKYTENIFSYGFEWSETSRVDAITLFEVFEHFDDPISELKSLLEVSDTIIFSTTLLPNPIPKTEDWWYYGLDHGQHIAFYSTNTFAYIADKFQLNYISNGPLHVLSRKNLSSWKLHASMFSKLGLHKLVERKMTSKTLSDYESMSKEST